MLWLEFDGLTIAPPGAIVGQIHVKTEYGSSEIADAISSIKKAVDVCKFEQPQFRIWSSIFFFASSNAKTSESWKNLLSTALSKFEKEDVMIDCIAVLDGPIILRTFDEDTGASSYCGYDGKEATSGVFLAHAYQHLAKTGEGLALRSALAKYVDALNLSLQFEVHL